MEIRYPILILLVPATLFLILYFIKKKNNYADNLGSKIANTSYLEKTDYYKKKIKEYKFIKILSYSFFIGIVIFSTILVSRPTRVEKKEISKYNRDIMLCMDVSTSVNELNLELVDSLKETVNKLHGERFGISIFNTSSVVLVPLTDDYEYVKSILDNIAKSIKTTTNSDYKSSYDDDDNYFYYLRYLYSGTTEGSKERGSSLIGDGLASCVYDFSNLEEERSRIIIFSTDNALEGTPLLTLDEAAKISRKKNIKVFGIGTKSMLKSNRDNFESAILKTDGKFYEHSKSTVGNIVNDIESTSKSLLKSKTETKRYDMPEVPFILLIICLIGFIFSSRKVIS